MPESKNKNHRPLYPKAKTFDEIYAAKKQRELENRPRFVATKVSIWSTFGVVVALVAYLLISALVSGLGALPSTGEVLFAVAAFIFVGFVSLVILRSLFILIKNIVSRALPATRLLLIILVLVFIISLIALTMLPSYSQANLVGVGVVLMFNFVVSWVKVRWVVGGYINT